MKLILTLCLLLSSFTALAAKPKECTTYYATGVVACEGPRMLVMRVPGGFRPYAKGDISVNGEVIEHQAFLSDAELESLTRYDLVTGHMDPQEWHAFWTMAGGYGLDLITTQIKLGQGCVEANPLARGPVIVRILPPAFHLTMYYVMAKQTPFGQPFALKQTKGFGYFRGAVGLHNLTVSCR